MKPIELTSIFEVWRTAISSLQESLSIDSSDLQVWFPWGRFWRGHDRNSSLPPTDLPADLSDGSTSRFGGRIWRCINVSDSKWLLSIRGNAQIEKKFRDWYPDEDLLSSLRMLAEFLRLEGLLGLSMKVLEQRAGEHGGHWERVRQFSTAIARKLGFSGEALIKVELAGLLHDIGKIAVPAAILEQVRPLSPAERKQVETHSLVGSTMIREIPGMEDVAEYVMSHHEAPDGSGYPRGLKAGEISLPALIIAAADSFDAMTHHRPYATQKTYHDTIREMTGNTGKYDDRVLWALQDVLRELGILDSKPMVTGPGEIPRQK